MSHSGEVKPDYKRGYVSSVEDARKEVEALFNKEIKES